MFTCNFLVASIYHVTHTREAYWRGKDLSGSFSSSDCHKLYLSVNDLLALGAKPCTHWRRWSLASSTSFFGWFLRLWFALKHLLQIWIYRHLPSKEHSPVLNLMQISLPVQGSAGLVNFVFPWRNLLDPMTFCSFSTDWCKWGVSEAHGNLRVACSCLYW